MFRNVNSSIQIAYLLSICLYLFCCSYGKWLFPSQMMLQWMVHVKRIHFPSMLYSLIDRHDKSSLILVHITIKIRFNSFDFVNKMPFLYQIKTWWSQSVKFKTNTTCWRRLSVTQRLSLMEQELLILPEVFIEVCIAQSLVSYVRCVCLWIIVCPFYLTIALYVLWFMTCDYLFVSSNVSYSSQRKSR